MAPKKHVSATMEQVKALPHNAQVDLLAQALLREYMHRKAYKRTLHMFDQECPRDDNTVSSRQIMNDALGLQQIQTQNKELPEKTSTAAGAVAALSSFDTIMDVLCWYRVSKNKRRNEPERSRGDARLLQIDSSDDETDAENEKMKKRQLEARQQKEAALHEELQGKVNELKAQIEAEQTKISSIRAKKEKLSNGKNSSSSSNDKKASTKNGKQSAILSTAMDSVSSLPVSSGGSARSRGAGQSWTPGGGSTGATPPSVGLHTSAALSASLPSTTGPASFYAGTGMHLMADRPSARAGGPSSTSWEAGRPRSSSTGSTADDDIPSPYAKLGQTPYDPNAKAKSVLARATGASPTDQPARPRHFPSFSSGGGGGSGSRSPDAASTSVSDQFAGSVSIGSPFAGQGAASGRKSRRVTIIAD